MFLIPDELGEFDPTHLWHLHVEDGDAVVGGGLEKGVDLDDLGFNRPHHRTPELLRISFRLIETGPD